MDFFLEIYSFLTWKEHERYSGHMLKFYVMFENIVIIGDLRSIVL